MLVTVLGLSLLGAGIWAVFGRTAQEAAGRVILFGEPLLEVRAPHPGQWVAQGGVEIVVQYPVSERIAWETFRCLLNGHDVTDRLTRGRNGAAGSVVGAVEGPNLLRVEVFGQTWWGGDYLEDAVELTFRVRPLPALERA